ncbi:MAG: hypothetical protein J7L82_00105 [Staphylothermus sp.]|nr:hypothetical protein [Staphylothermus sp.]
MAESLVKVSNQCNELEYFVTFCCSGPRNFFIHLHGADVHHRLQEE